MQSGPYAAPARLLSGNGPNYIAQAPADYIQAKDIDRVRGAPLHPQTQAKIEHWHETPQNRVLLANYFLPGDPESQIEALVEPQIIGGQHQHNDEPNSPLIRTPICAKTSKDGQC